MSRNEKAADMSGLYAAAIKAGVTKLDPRTLWRNPVMFVTEVGACLVTASLAQALVSHQGRAAHTATVAVILWLTILFANFAESLAEARGRAQADTLRRTRRQTAARRGHESRGIRRCRAGNRHRAAASRRPPAAWGCECG